VLADSEALGSALLANGRGVCGYRAAASKAGFGFGVVSHFGVLSIAYYLLLTTLCLLRFAYCNFRVVGELCNMV
jgi:hypothetical protein